MMKYF